MEQAVIVDSEIQASISNLVSALGGLESSSGEYKLGDDALACLRDLRKWLQNYDAKYERLDVSCAIANTTLVSIDIPEILGQWESKVRKKHDSYQDRIALACLELLVPLTWPSKLAGKEDTTDIFSQFMFLKQSQKQYKEKLIMHKSHNVLRAVIRLAASSLKTPFKDREPREEGILTLACSFFRNLLFIESRDDQDRTTTIEEYRRQKVLGFFTTLGAGMGNSLDAQFDAQDTLLAESLYLLFRGVDVNRVYGIDTKDEVLNDPWDQNLSKMLKQESDNMKSTFKPSRHSRFGTMVSMDEGGGDRISISGQRAVAGSMGSALKQLDSSKKWHRPRYRDATDEHEKTSYMPTTTTVNADPKGLETLRNFVNDFLDSSYNPLFAKLTRLIDRQQCPRIAAIAPLIHYCYLTAWFMEAQRARSKSESVPMDYRLVGASLSKTSFGMMMNLLRRANEPGDYKSTDLAHAVMCALCQILHSIRDMSYVQGDDDLRDVAEGMKSRLFYEETWLTLLSQVPRTSHRKSLAYACDSIALTHIVLKMLDEYTKKHSIMYVRSSLKRRKRTKQNEIASTDNSDAEDAQHEREAVRTANERKFSYDKFVLKYINSPTIDTYERVLSSYREISEETVLHIFSFLRRTFARTRCRALFYRMSFMRLLLELVGHGGLDHNSATRKVADEFLAFYVNKFARTAAQMPSLHIQLNENISAADAFYYDHGGQDRAKFKPPKFELTLSQKAKSELSAEKQMAIIVAALIDIGKQPVLTWTQEIFTGLLGKEGEQSKIGKQQQAFTVDKDRLKSIHNDALQRLFLRSLGLIVNTTEGHIFIPSSIDEFDLIQKLEWVSKYQNETVELPGNRLAMDFIVVDNGRDQTDEDYEDEATANQTVNQTRRSSPTAIQHSFRHPSPTEPGEEPTDQQIPRKTGDGENTAIETSKRNYSAAFALENSDDESDDHVSRAIAPIRRRQAIGDDDDEDEDDHN